MRLPVRDAHRLRSDVGASAVEYGLIVAAVAVLIIGVVFAFGNAVHNSFESSTTCLGNATTPNAPTFTGCPQNP